MFFLKAPHLKDPCLFTIRQIIILKRIRTRDVTNQLFQIGLGPAPPSPGSVVLCALAFKTTILEIKNNNFDF